MRSVWKTDEREAEIIFLIFFLWECFNCQWLRSGGVGHKVLFRASWNWIFFLLLRLKSRSARGASRYPEDAGSVQNFIFWFCGWCKSRKLGGRMSSRLPWVTPKLESFSFDLLQAIINYWTESYLKSCQTSTKELVFKNSQRPKDVDHFLRKDASQMFDWIPNVLPVGKVL